LDYFYRSEKQQEKSYFSSDNQLVIEFQNVVVASRATVLSI